MRQFTVTLAAVALLSLAASQAMAGGVKVRSSKGIPILGHAPASAEVQQVAHRHHAPPRGHHGRSYYRGHHGYRHHGHHYARPPIVVSPRVYGVYPYGYPYYGYRVPYRGFTYGSRGLSLSFGF